MSKYTSRLPDKRIHIKLVSSDIYMVYSFELLINYASVVQHFRPWLLISYLTKYKCNLTVQTCNTRSKKYQRSNHGDCSITLHDSYIFPSALTWENLSIKCNNCTSTIKKNFKIVLFHGQMLLKALSRLYLATFYSRNTFMSLLLLLFFQLMRKFVKTTWHFYNIFNRKLC